AVGQERLAVARDLHDVASGAIGVMMLHASVATVKRTADPVAARTALDDVAAAGDAALVQLALLERALGPGPGEDHEAALELLVARARSHGLDARLELLDVPRDPAAAGVVWRVVHEALTNAVKHAPGARVEVRVARQDEHVVVTVHDDGAPGAEQTPRAAGAPGTGLGLRGLAEQVDLRSGTFRHGPRAAPSPGFMVEARLPDPAE
ncbi:MAG: sensor histidine kinase, partial [Actinomycetales bacterium]|nr:sensor histidine kinase [Actinomycetales bacterium]